MNQAETRCLLCNRGGTACIIHLRNPQAEPIRWRQRPTMSATLLSLLGKILFTVGFVYLIGYTCAGAITQ